MSNNADRTPIRDRLLIPDVLRGAAILAMLIAHAAPFVPDQSWAIKYIGSNINDLASPLFALVMGMSAQLTWRRSARVPLTLLQQGLRGGILIVLGMWMSTWGSWVAIVLQPLGLLLIVGVPLLLLGTRMVWFLLILVLLVSQPVVSAARDAATWFIAHGPVMTNFADWAVNGAHYRLMNLLPFFLLGGLLIRRNLKRDRMTWGMAIIVPLAYLPPAVIKGLDLYPVTTGDYLDTLHDVGLVFAAYVVVVLISTADSGPMFGRLRDAVLTPLRAWGQLALSLYVLHVGVLAVALRTYGWPDRNVYVGWLVIVPGMCIVAWLWWRFVGTGPVEWAMGLLTGRRKSLRQPQRQAVSVAVKR